MGQRPRLGGDGELLVPEWVVVTRRGVVLSDLGPGGYDPFLRRPDGLLLVESFARLDLSHPRKLRSWILANGTLDRVEFRGRDPDEIGAYELVEDEHDWWVIEQRDVRWLLFVLAVLTLTLPPPVGDGRPYDPAWHPEGPWVEDPALEAGWGTWWREPTPENLLRIAGFAMNEYVERAMRPGVVLGHVGSFPIRPVLGHRWTSILAPIYLQLYEGLRRVSEGRAGARGCRACRQIFLVLDGRRERFCTTAERAAFHQRAYRARRRAAG